MQIPLPTWEAAKATDDKVLIQAYADAAACREQLEDRVAEVDAEIGKLLPLSDKRLYISGTGVAQPAIDAAMLRASIRRAVIARKFVPVFLGR